VIRLEARENLKIPKNPPRRRRSRRLRAMMTTTKMTKKWKTLQFPKKHLPRRRRMTMNMRKMRKMRLPRKEK